MATDDLWSQYRRLDDALQFKILRFAGREAAASFRIACGKVEVWPKEVGIAEQAVLYEPFTYWDWQEQDAGFFAAERQEGQAVDSLKVEDRRRKRRILWERERAFKVNGVWHEYPTPRGRWSAFKRAFERNDDCRRHVKRIAVASWMTTLDLEWIAQSFPYLEALDLSNVPENELTSGSGAPWPAYLGRLQELNRRPRGMNIEDLELFTYLESFEQGGIESFPEESERLRAFLENQENPDYHVPGPLGTREAFEEFFQRLLQEQASYESRTGEPRSQELRDMEAAISESRLCARLKWLGVRDWRLKSISRHVCQFARKCRSLTTFSIRGNYDRDYESNEIPSIHDHVCKFVGGVISSIPDTVKAIELRLSLPFLKYFMEQLRQHRPSVARIGIDLGAWVQIYPLRKPSRTLSDADVRSKAISIARKKRFEIYDEQREDFSSQDMAWNLPDDHRADYEDYGRGQVYQSKLRNTYRDLSGTIVQREVVRIPDNSHETTGNGSIPSAISPVNEYDFFNNHAVEGSEPECPFDDQPHKQIAHDLDATRVDTLSKMLRRLYLARHVPDDARRTWGRRRGKKASQQEGVAGREGATFFALEPELEDRSTDPVHPLTLIQLSNKTEFKSGDATDHLKSIDVSTVYSWLERTFRWRPVFDWDWFMVPERMAKIADPDLVTIYSEEDWNPSKSAAFPENNVLSRVLKTIAAHFKHFRECGMPVHLLIGRRDPEASSCYWGWPYEEDEWEQWKNEPFSANLETIAPYVVTLSILYDLRHPLDLDRQNELKDDENRSKTRAMCPLRSCPCPKGTCYFKRFTPGPHPRPQVNKILPFTAKSGFQKMANKRKLRHRHDTPKGYGGLASSCSGGFPSGENANDHPSDDSDGEGSPSAHPSRHHLARRAAFTREALGWHRFWNKYALEFTSLTALRVRMPRCFDKVGSWRLAKLLSPGDGWNMLMYTDERQYMQTREDLMPVLSPDSSCVFEHKSEVRLYPAGRFVRRAWVWDRMITGSEDGFQRREHPKAVVEDPSGASSLPAKCLTTDFHERLNWAKRTFTSDDWEATKEGDEVELAKAIQKALDATNREKARAPFDEGQKRAGQGFNLDFTSKYGNHIRNVAGDQWRYVIRSLAADLQDGGDDSDDDSEIILEQMAERLRELASARPPYEEIFRQTDDEDIHPTSGLQWKDGLTLQSGTVDQIMEEEGKRRASSELGLPSETAQSQDLTVPFDAEDDSASFVSGFASDSVSEAVVEIASAASEVHNQRPVPSIQIEISDKTPPDSAGIEDQSYESYDATRHLESSSPGPELLGPVQRGRKTKRPLPFDESSSDEDQTRKQGARSPKKARTEGPHEPHEGQKSLAVDEDVAVSEDSIGSEPRTMVEQDKNSQMEGAAAEEKEETPSDVRSKALPSYDVEIVDETPTPEEANEDPPGPAAKQIASSEVGIRDDTPFGSDGHATKSPGPDQPNSEPVQEKSKQSRKRNTPTPSLSNGGAADEAEAETAGPAKRARTTRSTAKQAPANTEEDVHGDKGAQIRKKRGTKRSASGAAFKPPKEDEEGSESDDNDLPPTRERGRARTSKSRTSDVHRYGKNVDPNARLEAKSKSLASSSRGASDAGDAGNGVERLDYGSLTVAKLKEMLKARGVRLTGMTRKAQFVERLESLDREGYGEA